MDAATSEEIKCTVLAGKVAFNLEHYIFRKVLPTRLIKPFIYPRNISDLSALIVVYKCMGEEASLEGADKRWGVLQDILQWDTQYEYVLEVLKHKYLLIKPSQDILDMCIRDVHDINRIRRAFSASLPVALRPAGHEVVDMMIPLGLT